ncbi:MAG: hypothetical protein UMU75_03730 [Halomonas sp.]|nr:hypothetical protein [Halomonas sp.]
MKIIYRSCLLALLGVATPSTFADTPGNAASQPQSSQQSARYLRVNSVGDVFWDSSTNPAAWHVNGGLALWTSDYFRARYGGVPASLERLSYRLSLGTTFELVPSAGTGQGPFEAVSLSLGMLNYFTDSPVPNADAWYTGDRYLGLSAAFGKHWLGGLTYTRYKNPDSPPGVPQDIALSLRYVANGWLGALQPQVKAVKAVGSGTGHLFQASISPSFKPFAKTGLTVGVPLDVGVGVNGYQGASVDRGYYAELGLTLGVPLAWKVPGVWGLSGGIYATWRNQAIVEATQRFDDAGSLVPTGAVSLTFSY